MLTDPLSEAVDIAKAAIAHLHSTPQQRRAAERDLSQRLARLDAIPAPVRYEAGAWPHDGWLYPDAPLARKDGGEDAG